VTADAPNKRTIGRSAPRISPRVAVAVLAAAVLVWAVVFGWMVYRGRAQRHIEAGIEAARSFQGLRAEREWREAVQVDPANAAAWDLLGEYYLSTNDQTAARDAFAHELLLRPNQADVAARLAGTCLKTGDEVAALKYAEQALTGDPNSVEALEVAAPLLAGLSDEKRRLEYLRRLVTLKPDDRPTLTMLAVALSDNHAYAEADPVLTRLLKIARDDTVALTLRGESRFNTDPSLPGLARAKADFLAAVRANAGNALAHLYLGRIAKRQGQTAEAIVHLETAARLKPNKPDSFFELAGAYDRMGRTKDAARARQQFAVIRARIDTASRLEKQAALDPKDFEARRAMGLLALGDADYRKASFYLNGAHALRPDDGQTNDALQRLAALRERLIGPGR
jgi:Flp pilus assembly protein TadD